MLAREPVSRLMTAIVTSVDVHSPPGELLRLFAEYPFHHLPVVDRTRVVGMLSSVDLLRLETLVPRDAPNPAEYLNQHVRISTVMRRPPITISGTETIERAARLMVAQGIHALPVTDADGHLLGIITTTDIIHAALQPKRRGDTPESTGASPESATARSLETGSASVSPMEMDRALRLAAAAARGSDDQAQIARALLHAHSRLTPLENVLSCAARYLRAGQDERLHRALVKAVDRARAGESGAAVGL